MSNSNDFFSKRKVQKAKFAEIAEGEHVVRITSVKKLDSFKNYNGSEKEDLPEWDNPTPQLAVTMVMAEDGKSGGITHRFNGCGFVKFEDLTEKQLKSGKYSDIGGYACYEHKQGDETFIVREESEEKTEACGNIIDQFSAAVGLEVGSNFIEGLEEAIANQSTFKITVVTESYGDKDQKKVARFKQVAKTEEEAFHN